MPSNLSADLDHDIGEAQTRLHQANSKAAILSATLDLADLTLKAAEGASDEVQRSQLKRDCQTLLQKAARIKAETKWTPKPFGRTDPAKVSLLSHALSPREQIILLEGSKLHGHVFPPWKASPSASVFDLLEHGPFIENVELALSKTQGKIFDGWRKATDLFAVPLDQADGSLPTTGVDHRRVDLVQDVATDCSVVASLSAMIARAEHGHPEMVSSLVFPFDHRSMKPAASSNGKYVFKLHFNGCYREVIVDDYLPASSTSQKLYVTDRNDPTSFWPALLEKGYLKTRGGYDFPGSNSGTDLRAFTGWIPEQIFLQSVDVRQNELWLAIFENFHAGNLLLTLGTGTLTRRDEELIGLPSEHDFAVVEIAQRDDQRLLLIKNPWAETQAWKGGKLNIVKQSPSNDVSIKAQSDLAEPENHDKNATLAPGIFWMGLNDVFQNFESMYLNWNTDLFPEQKVAHFTWDLSTLRTPAGSVIRNPQYVFQSQQRASLWILLSKHITTTDADQGFISLYGFENQGNKVYSIDGPLERCPYVDSPNVLMKLDISPQKTITVVVSEQGLPQTRRNFSLFAYSNEPFSLALATERYQNITTVSGSWTSLTSGGNASSSSYSLNPQYSVTLSESTDLSLLLESEEADFLVHVKLTWGGGSRVISVTTSDVVGDSGPYKKGYAFAELRDVQAGAYTIVCSTFESGQAGKFSLRAGAMCDLIMTKICGEMAGRLVTRMPPAIFTTGTRRLVAPFKFDRLNSIRIVVQGPAMNTLSNCGPCSPLRVALEVGIGVEKQVVAISNKGRFTSSHTGLRTAEVDIEARVCQAKGICIALERLGDSNGQDEGVGVDVISTEPIETGSWHVA